jgi:hypothetical protein
MESPEISPQTEKEVLAIEDFETHEEFLPAQEHCNPVVDEQQEEHGTILDATKLPAASTASLTCYVV